MQVSRIFSFRIHLPGGTGTSTMAQAGGSKDFPWADEVHHFSMLPRHIAESFLMGILNRALGTKYRVLAYGVRLMRDQGRERRGTFSYLSSCPSILDGCTASLDVMLCFLFAG